MRRVSLAVAMLALVASSAVADGARPKFEAASVKRNTSGPGRSRLVFQPGGRLSVMNLPLRTIIVAACTTIPQIASGLARTPGINRPVVDKTGLTGAFDFDLVFTPDQMPQSEQQAGAPPMPPIDPNGPSLFTALQEQLGLKLEPSRGPVEVIVIDRVEPPTDD